MLLTDIILHEDENFIIINKPQGIVVNNSQTSNKGTIAEMSKNYLKLVKPRNLLKLSLNDQEFYDRFGIVHRLDKETCGVLIIAKTPESYSKIKEQFIKRKVEKEYHAVCFNDISRYFNSKPKLIVNLPLLRDVSNRHQFAVSKQGREAISHIYLQYNFLSTVIVNSTGFFENTHFSFIKIIPKTGRTHQIRVHLKALNCELVGDDIYGGRIQKKFNEKFNLKLCLIAKKISFKVYNKKYTFEADYNENFTRAVKTTMYKSS